jgi:hypothetical protein
MVSSQHRPFFVSFASAKASRPFAVSLTRQRPGEAVKNEGTHTHTPKEEKNEGDKRKRERGKKEEEKTQRENRIPH